MKRYAFTFKIHPHLKREYQEAHDNIWPEMAQAIQSSGIRNYSIYFQDDGTLFSYLECEDPQEAFAYLKKQEVNTRWQKEMDRFFVKNSTLLGPEMSEIEEVFHQN